MEERLIKWKWRGRIDEEALKEIRKEITRKNRKREEKTGEEREGRNKKSDEERNKDKSTGRRQREGKGNSIEAYRLIVAMAQGYWQIHGPAEGRLLLRNPRKISDDGTEAAERGEGAGRGA